MSTSKDGPGKDGGKPGEAPKRPHATIDLKATEVAVRDVKGAAGAKGDDAGPQAASAAAAAAAARTEPTKAEPSKTEPNKPEPGKSDPVKGASALGGSAASGKTDARPGTTSTSAQGSVPTTGTAAKSGGAREPQPAPKGGSAASAAAPSQSARSGSGIGRFFTLLAAALLGGVGAIWASDAFAPQLAEFGITTGGGASKALETRLTAIEAAQRRAPEGAIAPSALAERMDAAERRLAQIDELASTLAGVRKSQAEAADQAKAMAEKLAQGGPADAGARLSRLEESLRMLSTATGADGQPNRIAQLAGITGKLTDLEATIASQTASLRRGLLQELESRIAQTAEAGETAKSGTLRLDRDVSAMKTEGARVAQRVEAAKADTERLSTTVRSLQEEAGSLRSALETLKGDVASQLRDVARPTDVTKALEPVATRIAALESNVQGVVRSEEDRRQNVSRIVLALELGNLKRVVDSGQRYGAELAELVKASGPRPELAALARFKDQGVPTLADLTRDFRPVLNAVMDADAEPVEGGVMDRLLSGAKSIVRVRKTGHAADDKSAEAVTARMEAALKAGRLGDVLAEARTLPERPAAAAKPWLAKVEARHAVEGAIAAIEGQLKASLSGAGVMPAKAAN